jgi:hypothetical protein
MKTGQKAMTKFWELKDKCFDEDYDLIDNLHDDLFYQIQGLGESIMEAKEDPNAYEKEFKEALCLAQSIEAYFNRVEGGQTKEEEFNFIYG